MDTTDRRLLDALQMDFPLSLRPYAVIGEQLGLAEEEVWRRVQALRERGVIRRLGASLDSRKLGYQSTLVGIRVAADRVERASALLDALPEVTHCYLRRDDYNIWFTLIAVDRPRIERILADLRAELDLAEEDVLDVPVERLFKLDARFRASDR